VLEASNIIHQAHLNMKALRQEWERELRAGAEPKALAAPLSSGDE
jgi:hypothetical protein